MCRRANVGAGIPSALRLGAEDPGDRGKGVRPVYVLFRGLRAKPLTAAERPPERTLRISGTGLRAERPRGGDEVLGPERDQLVPLE
jgi:hypothetical protein